MILSAKVRRMGETILISCLVVLLTGIWARGTSNSKLEAQDSSKQIQVVTIAKALNRYQVDHGEYPEVVYGLPFCTPFEVYGYERCLGELLGNYIQADSIDFTDGTYVYMDAYDHVFVAADMKVNAEIPVHNRCLINNAEFWCIKLMK